MGRGRALRRFDLGSSFAALGGLHARIRVPVELVRRPAS